MTKANELHCPFHTETNENSPKSVSQYSPEELRNYLFDWYQKSGFRGCLFNKVAARDARNGDFVWHTPVHNETIEDILHNDGGLRILETFDKVIGDGTREGLASVMFPSINSPKELGELVKYLHQANPDKFQLFDIVDRETMPGFGEQEFVGIQFRIKIGSTSDGEDALAYPMIYNPWEFTTFARRFDVPMITFNTFNSKQNPETPDSYIGVDDIDLSRSLDDQAFAKMLQRSISIRKQAHSSSGSKDDSYEYSRQLYRAHNALVLPVEAWEDQ